MKFSIKNAQTLLTGFVLILFNSCVKLDEIPKSIVSPESFYKSEADFQSATVGIYRPLFSSYGGFSYDMPFVAECGAEDIHTSVGRWQGMETLTATPDQFNEATSEMWSSIYRSINNANSLIAQVPNATSIANIGNYEGQARFLRAFGYFNLVRWFGKVPLITPENAATADKAGEAEIADIYTFILNDLKIAEEKLPLSSASNGIVNKVAAKALLAKVYLTMAGWPLNQTDKYALARDKAKEVMDLNIYSLENNFADLWKVAKKLSNREVIWAFHGSSGGDWRVGSHFHVATRPSEEKGWQDFETDKRFLAMFPAGPRKDATFHTVFFNGAQGGLPYENSIFKQPTIAKFRDAGSVATPNGGDGAYVGFDGDGYFPVLRYADVLLMYAEAANMVEGTPSTTAREAINKVRRRAMGHNPDVPNATDDLSISITKAGFDKAVLDERNWELAFEHNRWNDLVRRDLLVQVMGAPEWYPGVQPYRKLLPKPVAEVLRIKGLNQNTGY